MRNGKWVVAATAIAAAVAMSPRPGVAAEPAHFAVMGVRLYMNAQEVLTSLYAQGVREDGVSEHVHPCALHVEVACTDTITARLPDGPIVIRFVDAPPGFNDGREAAFSIAYRPSGSTREAGGLRNVAEERFGPLSDAADGAWCMPAAGGACPRDRPRMTFRRGGPGGAELALTDLGLPDRLAPGGAAKAEVSARAD
ncbi:MAG TPA: hypothetical protein VIJ55_10930 [Acetobacteraceae bacterium]